MGEHAKNVHDLKHNADGKHDVALVECETDSNTCSRPETKEVGSVPKTEKYAYNHFYRRCIDKFTSHHFPDLRPTWLIVRKECTHESNKMTSRKFESMGMGCPGKRSENSNDRNSLRLCHRGMLSFTRCNRDIKEESRTGSPEESHIETDKSAVVGATKSNFPVDCGPTFGDTLVENHVCADTYCFHADETAPASVMGVASIREMDSTDARPDLGVTFHV